jgi:transcription termination/antitermination protein NusG
VLSISENPPIIWPQVETISQFTGRWWVAHTKSRNEKALAQDLITRGISYFLPMSLKVSRKSRRTMKSLLPLFSGYLFFCGQDTLCSEIKRTDRVANIIEVIDQAKLVSELVQIERVLQTGEPILPHDYIRTGQKCRVIAGPLMGLQGIVITIKGATRLVLQVDMLGQAASVEIDIDMIEMIE